MSTDKIVHAVVGILQRKQLVLVAQRPLDKPYSGYWEFPGGKVEAGETSEFALKRELFEELNIHVTEASPSFQHKHTYPDKTVLLDVWVVSAFQGEPIAQEQQQLRWVNQSELNELNLLEGNWAILEKIKILMIEAEQ